MSVHPVKTGISEHLTDKNSATLIFFYYCITIIIRMNILFFPLFVLCQRLITFYNILEAILNVMNILWFFCIHFKDTNGKLTHQCSGLLS